MTIPNIKFSIEFLSRNRFADGYQIGTSLGLSENIKNGIYTDLNINIQNLMEEALKINFILEKAENSPFTLKWLKYCNSDMEFTVIPKNYAFCIVTPIRKTIKEGQEDRLKIVIHTLANTIIKELNYELVQLNPKLVSNYTPAVNSLRNPYFPANIIEPDSIKERVVSKDQTNPTSLLSIIDSKDPRQSATLTSPGPVRSVVRYSRTRENFHRTFQAYNIPTHLIFPDRQTNHFK